MTDDGKSRDGSRITGRRAAARARRRRRLAEALRRNLPKRRHQRAARDRAPSGSPPDTE